MKRARQCISLRVVVVKCKKTNLLDDSRNGYENGFVFLVAFLFIVRAKNGKIKATNLKKKKKLKRG